MKTEAIDQIEFRSPELMFQLQSMRQIYDNAAGQVDVAHRHNYHTALLVEKASGKHLIDYNTYDFGIRQVHLVSPGQVHQVIVDAKPKGHVITFSKAFLISNGISLDFINNINLFNAFGNTQPIGLNSEVFKKLSGFVDMMQDCEGLSSNHKLRALGSLLQLFLIQIESYQSNQEGIDNFDSRTSCLVRDFKSLVDDGFNEHHKVSFYADHLNLTSKHLSTTLKKLTGRTAKEHIQDRILLEAKILLLHTDIRLKEVAYKIGFEEPVHFSSFFKKTMNMSPSDYRKKN